MFSGLECRLGSSGRLCCGPAPSLAWPTLVPCPVSSLPCLPLPSPHPRMFHAAQRQTHFWWLLGSLRPVRRASHASPLPATAKFFCNGHFPGKSHTTKEQDPAISDESKDWVAQKVMEYSASPIPSFWYHWQSLSRISNKSPLSKPLSIFVLRKKEWTFAVSEPESEVA